MRFVEFITPFAEAAGVLAIGLAALVAIGAAVYAASELWDRFHDAD